MIRSSRENDPVYCWRSPKCKAFRRRQNVSVCVKPLWSLLNLFSSPTCLVCDLCLVRSQGHHSNYCDNYFKHFHHIHFHQYSDNFAGWVANNFVRSHSSTVLWPWPCSMNYQWLHDATCGWFKRKTLSNLSTTHLFSVLCSSHCFCGFRKHPLTKAASLVSSTCTTAAVATVARRCRSTWWHWGNWSFSNSKFLSNLSSHFDVFNKSWTSPILSFDQHFDFLLHQFLNCDYWKATISFSSTPEAVKFSVLWICFVEMLESLLSCNTFWVGKEHFFPLLRSWRLSSWVPPNSWEVNWWSLTFLVWHELSAWSCRLIRSYSKSMQKLSQQSRNGNGNIS